MDLELRGKVAAVTGGSRGVGLATALRLADEGAAVAICARGAEDLARAHALIEARGGRCLAFSCDLSVAGEAASFIAAAAETFGRLDGLVCAAGGAPAGTLEDPPDAGAAFRLTLFHAVEAARAAASLMGEGSAILFLAVDAPEAERWEEGAARAALGHAVSSLAQELAGPGTRVNMVMPAADARAAEIADIGAFLLSARASGVNGALLRLGGGGRGEAQP